MTVARAHGGRNHAKPHESWRERLLSFATVTATAALIWIWASSQTRQSAEANCRIHFVPSAADTQSVGPEEPISVRIQFNGSKSEVEDAVNAVNGRVFDIVVGTAGIPGTPGGHEVSLAELIAAMPAIEEIGVRVQSVQPSIANVAIETVIRREARVLVRTAGGTAVLTAVADPQVVSIWIPEPLLPRLVEPVTVEAIVGEGFLASPVGAVTEVPVALPADVAAVVGRARIDPVRVRVRSMQP
jgi:hypothetical protein